MSFIHKRYKYFVRLSEWFAQPWVRFVALTIYYLGILVGLIAIYGKGDFSTPPFIYQNF
jgi:D-Ala-teichoic acid biosynthesis protein